MGTPPAVGLQPQVRGAKTEGVGPQALPQWEGVLSKVKKVKMAGANVMEDTPLLLYAWDKAAEKV